ncbi:MAG: M56 family metallopeptidase [bacterium]
MFFASSLPLDSADARALLALLIDTSLKGGIILAAAAALTAGWRRGAAASRHLLWLLAISSVLALPALRIIVPAWGLPWGPDILALPEADAISTVAITEPATTVVPSRSIPWGAIVLAIWAAGAFVFLVRFAIGMFAASRLARRSTPDMNSGWARELTDLAGALGLSRRVELRRCAEKTMPMTLGAFRPVLLLPREADAWPLLQKRLVLLHELAHIRRWDCLTQIPAQIACAVFWFHPLVWFASRRLYLERERACDDAVLDAGVKASDYAQTLLETARGLAPLPAGLAAAAALARSPLIEGRLRAILDPRQSRRPAGILGGVLIALVVAALAVPLVALRPAPPPSAPVDAALNAATDSDATPLSVAANTPAGRSSKAASAEIAATAPAALPECKSRVEIMRLEAAASKHFLNRDWAKAAESFESLLECKPSDPQLWFELGYTNRALGSYDRSIQAYGRALALGHRPAVAMYNLACAYSMKNERDVAFEWLQKSLGAGFSFKELLTNDRDLENLRGDPRFDGLLAAYSLA